MSRIDVRYLRTVLPLAAILGLVKPLPAQECASSGNQFTRGADVELNLASQPDDPVAKEVRYQKALEKLERSFAEEPDLPRAYLLAGMAYIGLRDFVGADSMLKRLERAEPGCSDKIEELRFGAWVTWYNRGIAQLQGGDDAAALEAFEKANQIFVDARSLNNAASIYQRLGDTEQAIQLYSEALGAGGDEGMVRAASINLAELLRAEGRNEEALAIYEQYSASHPDDVLGRLNFAIALMDSGGSDQAEQAQEIFGELLGRDNLSFLQWSQVGIGLYRAQRFEEAVQAFERAHEINPYNKETLENLANSYYQSEDYNALLPLADTLVARYPAESVNYNLLANARREIEESGDAVLAVLERRDALTFEFLRMQLASQGEGAYVIEGQVMNKTAQADSEVSVPLEILGERGTVVLSDVLTLVLPPQGEVASFQLQVQLQEPVLGFQYRLPGS